MANRTDYVLWGSAGHAKVLNDLIRSIGGQVIALFDNSPDAKPAIDGVPLIGGKREFLSWVESRQNRYDTSALVAIGGARGEERITIQEFMSLHGLVFAPVIHPKAYVAETAVVGPGTQILGMAVVAADVRIGKACIVNHKASVDHECQLGDGVHVAPGATLCGCVTVDEFAMIGAGAVVLPRLHIGRGSIVGAGAVVTRCVPDGVIVVGNPATILRAHNLNNRS